MDEASLLAMGKRHGNTYTDPRIEDGYFWELSDTNGPEYGNAQNRGIVTLSDDDDHVRYWTKSRRGKKAGHTNREVRISVVASKPPLTIILRDQDNKTKGENALSKGNPQTLSRRSSSSHTIPAFTPSGRRAKKLRMRIKAANLRAKAAEERAEAAKERAIAAEERAQATELEIAAMDEDEKAGASEVPPVKQEVGKEARKEVKQEQDMDDMSDVSELELVI